MSHALRLALAPRWLALHVLVLAVSVGMVLLGRWQWRAAHVHHGSVQNYSYAFQWWVFTLFALLMWVRVVRDGARRLAGVPDGPPDGTAEPGVPAADVPAYRRYVMPQMGQIAPHDADDPVRTAYNAYLSRLAREEGAT